MTAYLFYPGCSMQRSARPYLDSLRAIQSDLGMQLEEVEDWNCCGATEYGAVHRWAAYALVGRNLALGQQQASFGVRSAERPGVNSAERPSQTLVAGCSACYLNLSKTDYYMRTNTEVQGMVNQALAAGGLRYDPGALQVRHLLDVITNDVGLEAVRARVVRPLTGLRVAPYYGCLLSRPDFDHRLDDYEYPVCLDRLLAALGATVVDFPLKTHCCSGHMTQISPPVAYELIRRLVDGATQARADLMATLCPMCQLNLDAFQGDMNAHFKTEYHMPVIYFTQLMGLAFGHEPVELGLGKEFVDARAALGRMGVTLPEEEETSAKPARRPRREEGLPMPRPRHDEEGVA